MVFVMVVDRGVQVIHDPLMQREQKMADEVYSRVGAAIRSRRDAIGLTQSSLAELTGLKRTSITNIESGGQAVMLHQFIELARALRTDVAELLAAADTVQRPVSAPMPAGPSAAELLNRMIAGGARAK